MAQQNKRSIAPMAGTKVVLNEKGRRDAVWSWWAAREKAAGRRVDHARFRAMLRVHPGLLNWISRGGNIWTVGTAGQYQDARRFTVVSQIVAHNKLPDKQPKGVPLWPKGLPEAVKPFAPGYKAPAPKPTPPPSPEPAPGRPDISAFFGPGFANTRWDMPGWQDLADRLARQGYDEEQTKSFIRSTPWHQETYRYIQPDMDERGYRQVWQSYVDVFKRYKGADPTDEEIGSFFVGKKAPQRLEQELSTEQKAADSYRADQRATALGTGVGITPQQEYQALLGEQGSGALMDFIKRGQEAMQALYGESGLVTAQTQLNTNRKPTQPSFGSPPDEEA